MLKQYLWRGLAVVRDLEHKKGQRFKKDMAPHVSELFQEAAEITQQNQFSVNYLALKVLLAAMLPQQFSFAHFCLDWTESTVADAHVDTGHSGAVGSGVTRDDLMIDTGVVTTSAPAEWGAPRRTDAH